MFKIKLKDFEGPFDLLLYFIKRDEIDIYDIPIAKITEEFLNYLHLLEIMDIEVASDFIVMAATLLQIKADMLLQINKSEKETLSDENDPRTPLVKQLIEYQKYKEAAKHLSERYDENQYYFYRKNFQSEINQSNEIGTHYKNASIFNLVDALSKVMKRGNADKQTFHQVNLFPITIEEKKNEILQILHLKSRIYFSKLIDNYSRFEIVVSFLALLELARTNEISLLQNSNFGEIVITLKLNLN
ncbi:MAG TPA: segregation/condensation protein A [Bacteroidota bacterium]|mgnify:FL=1|nr:segregation/condensation protein A [Candidatus Kapabacteria bacterium]HRS01044.1 segregation/condensation protein A [Bacteroidota bacterium]HRT67392.1 segregation/condensation protein A [Bacteroidota bacterium]